MFRMGWWGLGRVTLRSLALMFHRKLADVMPFAGAEETINPATTMSPILRAKIRITRRRLCVQSSPAQGGKLGSLACYHAESGGAPPHSTTQANIWCLITRPRLGVRRCSAAIKPSVLESSRPLGFGRRSCTRALLRSALISRVTNRLGRYRTANEIERAHRRITVSRSGPNYQKYCLE